MAKVNKEIVSPIKSRIPPKSMKSSIYNAHLYWSKKPYNVTASYIRHYTKRDHIVLDPFCGCGVVGYEALKLGRKTVVIDLNPLSTFVTRMICVSPVDLQTLNGRFQQVENSVKEKILEFYETQCEVCGGKAIVTTQYYDFEEPKSPLKYRCSACKKKGFKRPNKNDIEKIEQVNDIAESYLTNFPKIKLIENPRKQIEANTFVSDLSTKRNLLSLILLKEATIANMLILDSNRKE